MSNEQPLFIDCAGDQLLGILHYAVDVRPAVGMLLVVGGPQYRVGSHRQFVLLARDLAAAGIPVLRFDYRGMGDSTGAPRDFEAIAEDIGCALDALFTSVPGLRRAVIWGLCDAATANAFYAGSDDRIMGQIAANPWARTAGGEAQVYIRHYYLKRVLSAAFWRKVIALDFDPLSAWRDFSGKLRQSRHAGEATAAADERPLPLRLRDAQLSFAGPTLLILSGQDLTAREYEDRVAASAEWQRWMASPMVHVCRLEEADHTFSRASWRDQVARWSRDWIKRLAD
jgi:exosortase A-associated hydrolase 1